MHLCWHESKESMNLKKIIDKDFILERLSDYIRDLTSLGNPLFIVLFSLVILGFSKAMLILFIALIANELICYSIKLVYRKARPEKQKHGNLAELIDAGSFPSIHASRASLAYLTLMMNSSIYVSWIFVLLVVAVGYSRVYLKKHYWFDVAAGWVLGAVMSIGVWYFI